MNPQDCKKSYIQFHCGGKKKKKKRQKDSMQF